MSEYEVMQSERARKCCYCGESIPRKTNFLRQTYPAYGHSNYRNFCKDCGLGYLHGEEREIQQSIKELKK